MRALRVSGLAAAILLVLPLSAYAEEITNMRVAIDVHADGTAVVGESIVYDFGAAQRHGIYRDIELQYKDALGGTESIDIGDVSVTDEKNIPYPFSLSTSGGYEHIKIGDANKTVTGSKTYLITYTVRGAIGYFADHDEFYWNATGDQWQVPIRAAQVAVWTPQLAVSYACYTGVRGATQACATQTARLDGTGRPVALFTQGELSPGQGLTIAVSQPKGTIAEPTRAQKFWQLLSHNLPLALPFVTLAILCIVWWRFGRDARGRGTIIPEYEVPQGLSPVDIGELVNQRVRPADLSALLIQLAIRGYIKIERTESKAFGVFKSTDYRFHRVKDADDALSEEERILYDAVFPKKEDSVLASDIKSVRSLMKALRAVRSLVEKRMVSEGYYRARPATVRAAFLIVGFAIIGIVFFFLANSLTPLGAFAVGVSGALIALFSIIMPAKTKKGALVKESILGLKDYLQIAEKNRLDFHSAPERTPALFEKLLPAAMVLGVSTAWAKEFEGIYTEPPQWYMGGAYPIFSPTAFADDMDTFSAAAAALAAPTSGSGGAGGGGFSGGGFGGGGGGSW